jgi:hypothetical protein
MKPEVRNWKSEAGNRGCSDGSIPPFENKSKARGQQPDAGKVKKVQQRIIPSILNLNMSSLITAGLFTKTNSKDDGFHLLRIKFFRIKAMSGPAGFARHMGYQLFNKFRNGIFSFFAL